MVYSIVKSKKMLQDPSNKLIAIERVESTHALVNYVYLKDDEEVHDDKIGIETLVKMFKESIKMKQNSESVYVDNIKNIFEFLPILDNDPKHQFVNAHTFIAAPSGSGKSYFSGRLCENIPKYNSRYKKHRIFLITDKENIKNDDPAFDNLPEFDTINPHHENFEVLKLHHLKNSIVILDDYNAIKDKKVKKLIDSLKGEILQNGRKLGIICVVNNHHITNWNETRTDLHECPYFVFFPNSSKKQLKSVLKNYCLFDEDDSDKMLKLFHKKHAHLIFHQASPCYYMTEVEICIL